jgi:4'-phosphopantetheinyl transferase
MNVLAQPPIPAVLLAPQVVLVPVCVTPGRLRQMLSLLDADEAARARRFVHEADRAVYVASHARLRELLAIECGCAPQELRFVRGPFGKPALCPGHAQPLLRFNLSHSRGCAVIALTRDGSEPGVDIEAVERFDAMHEARSLFMTPAECAALADMHPLQRRDRLARSWTAKEAYTKAEGRGLAHGFHKLEVNFDGSERFSVRPADGTSARPMRGAWSGAVAVQGTFYRVAVVVLGAASPLA